MTDRARLSAAAQRDLIAVVDWYEKQKPGLGKEWFDAFDEAIQRAADHPESCSPIGRGMRKVRLERFPHVAVFTLSGPQLRVIAVLGDGQDWDAILDAR